MRYVANSEMCRGSRKPLRRAIPPQIHATYLEDRESAETAVQSRRALDTEAVWTAVAAAGAKIHSSRRPAYVTEPFDETLLVLDFGDSDNITDFATYRTTLS